MSAILKIKQWLRGKPQFEVIDKSESGALKAIKRLSDGQCFFLGTYPANSMSTFQVWAFDRDLIHVYLKLYANADWWGSKIANEAMERRYQANQLVITKQGYLQVSF